MKSTWSRFVSYNYLFTALIFVLFITFCFLSNDAIAENPSLDPLINLESSEPVNVIIELKQTPHTITKPEAGKQNTYFDETAAKEALHKEASEFSAYLENNKIDYENFKGYEEIFHGFSMTVKAKHIKGFLDLSYVKAIYKDQIYELKLNDDDDGTTDYEDVELLEVTKLWDMGLSGSGVKIGVIDSGLDFHHPAFEGVYKGGDNFIEDGMETPLEGHDDITSTHGTNVSGIIAANPVDGDQSLKGVAYDSDLYAYRVMDNDHRASTSHLLQAMEQAVKDEMDIINLSIGRNVNNPDTPLTRAINQTVKSGIVVVAANGNDGSEAMSVGDPGTASLALSVGATYMLNDQELIAPFSSRGPVSGTYDIKPDVAAPGAGIFSTVSLNASSGDSYENAYGFYSGTSMAAPYVTGIAALLLEADSSLKPEEIKAKLMNTGELIENTAVNDGGGGSVRALQALNSRAAVTAEHTIPYVENSGGERINYKSGSLNFGAVHTGGHHRQKQNLTVTNDTDDKLTFDLSLLSTAYSVSDESITVDLPDQVIVEGRSAADIPVILQSTNLETGGYFEGYILLEEERDGLLSVPFGAELELKPDLIESFEVTPEFINDAQDEVEISMNFIEDAEKIQLEVIDAITGNVLGEIADLQRDAMEEVFQWDLMYTHGENSSTSRLEDGFYHINLKAFTEAEHYFSETATLLMHSEPPVVELEGRDLTENRIQGTAYSYFSEYGSADEMLELYYSLGNDEGVYFSDYATLTEGGVFSIENRLKPGETVMNITVTDMAGNEKEQSFLISWSGEYKKGDEGEGVAAFKHKMARLGFETEEDAKNYFGEATQEKLKKLQVYFSMEVTGKADISTRKGVKALLDTFFIDGEETQEVRRFKQNLTALGFGTFPDTPSFRYGPVTESVVKDFQSYYHLAVNGVGDKVTLAKMEALLDASLKDGDDHGDVKTLKLNLTALGFGNFPEWPSTRYGPVTEGVVGEFQAANGISVSGTANPRTFKKINSQLNYVYKDGDERDEIIEFKKKLTSLGYGNFPAEPSARYGPVTEGIVKAFQQDNSLAVTGVANIPTQNEMARLLEVVYQDGDDENSITEMKKKLTSLGFGNFPEAPSTRYGPVTKGVVKDFQQYFGLAVTGIMNERNMDVLSSNASTELQNGNSSGEIRGLKIQLTNAGFGNFPANPSNNYGPVTEGVIKEFQQHYNLIDNGIADSVTLQKLKSAQQ